MWAGGTLRIGTDTRRAIHSESARTITYYIVGLTVVAGTVPGLKLETRTSNV